jgi:hypothetical protein
MVKIKYNIQEIESSIMNIGNDDHFFLISSSIYLNIPKFSSLLPVHIFLIMIPVNDHFYMPVIIVQKSQ